MFGATDVRTQVLCTQSQVLPHIMNLLGLISSTALPVWSTAMHTLFYLGQDSGRRSKPSDPAAGFVCSDTFQPCGMGTATCLNETTRHHRCRAAEIAARPQTKSWLSPFTSACSAESCNQASHSCKAGITGRWGALAWTVHAGCIAIASASVPCLSLTAVDLLSAVYG